MKTKRLFRILAGLLLLGNVALHLLVEPFPVWDHFLVAGAIILLMISQYISKKNENSQPVGK